MPEMYECPYCQKQLDVAVAPHHEPACKAAAAIVCLREVVQEGLKPRVELVPEGERDAKLKCPQCYIWMPDEHAFAIHVPLCKLVNEARLIYNALKRKRGGVEEQLTRIADALWEANEERDAEQVRDVLRGAGPPEK